MQTNSKIKRLLKLVGCNLPIFKHIFRTRDTGAPITIRMWFQQKVLGYNRSAYWPIHFTSKVQGVKNIEIGIGTAPGWNPGCYIQGGGKIRIGNYTLIAPNVGIISSNHNPYDYRKHIQGYIEIGNYCWIGMNAVILPNVKLGDHTIVGAGAVVNKSFPNGYCILAGVPASIVKIIDKSEVIEFKYKYEYYGYIPKHKFERKKKSN